MIKKISILSTNVAVCYYDLANVYIELDNLEAALKYFKKSIKADF